MLRKIIDRAGAGITVIDHSTNTGAKEGELRPSGSKHRTAGVTGASWFVKVIKPFVKGQGGKVQFIGANMATPTIRSRQCGLYLPGHEVHMIQGLR